MQYLEEPLQDASRLKEFIELTGLAVALDETVDETLRDNFREGLTKLSVMLDSMPIAGLVLKPSVIGGLNRCIQIACMASRHGCKVCISMPLRLDTGHQMSASCAVSMS